MAPAELGHAPRQGLWQQVLQVKFALVTSCLGSSSFTSIKMIAAAASNGGGNGRNCTTATSLLVAVAGSQVSL